MNRRTLVSVRRRLPSVENGQYDEAWEAARAGVAALKGHAWRFRSSSDPRLFIEFMEFGAEGDPRADPAVAGAMSRLEAIAPGTVETWTEANNTSPDEVK